MGDISREPLPGGQRKSGGPGKAPSDLIRFEELGAESLAAVRADRDADDPDAADDHLQSDAGARMTPDRPDGDAGSDAVPPAALPPETARAAEFLAQRLIDPPIPLEADSFGIVTTPSPEPSGEPEPTGPAAVGADPARPAEVDVAPVEVGTAVDSELAAGEPSEAELAADLGVDPLEAPAVATLVPDLTESADDVAPELRKAGEIARVALAVLLASREPLSLLRLAEVLNAETKAVSAGLDRLALDLRAQGMPLELLAVDGAYRVSSSPAVYPFLIRLKKLKKAERLTPAALETLAVIAYRQPVIRTEIEAIRGVKAGPVLKSLLDHKLVKAVGRADVPGRPLQYGTTQSFLDRFGLRSLDDLPSIQELRTLG